MNPAMKMKAALAVTLLIAAVFLVSTAISQPSPEHFGLKLVKENNCAACRQIGTSPFRLRATQNAPAFNRAGHRVEPDWLPADWPSPYRLRPNRKGRMPTFGFLPKEIGQIKDRLFSIDGPADRRGMMGRHRGMGPGCDVSRQGD